MYYRPVRITFLSNDNEDNKITCIFHMYAGLFTRNIISSNSHFAPKIILTINYLDRRNITRVKRVTFNENIKVVSNMGYISYEDFIDKVYTTRPSTNEFFKKHIVSSIDARILYNTYLKYQKQIMGQFGV